MVVFCFAMNSPAMAVFRARYLASQLIAVYINIFKCNIVSLITEFSHVSIGHLLLHAPPIDIDIYRTS